MIYLQSGKVNIIIDGQFGSTGKGVLSSYIGATNHIDLSITNSSPNAGHTFYFNAKKYIFKHLPSTAITNKRSTIYLCAGSIINPEILLHEIDKYKIDTNRICIHPRAAIITQDDIKNEYIGACVKLSSTQNGVGRALARKINRSAELAKDNLLLKKFVNRLDITYLLNIGCTALMEVPQGMDLSLNSGFEYPYCTSREISISQALSDLTIHPKWLGNVIVSLRTMPIRVGNLTDHMGKEIGYSGNFYPDSKEDSWEKLNIKPELTTNTKRVRRIASFSYKQYVKMLDLFDPDYIFLNFANYLTDEQLSKMLINLKKVTHLGFGKTLDDIITVNTYLEEYNG